MSGSPTPWLIPYLFFCSSLFTAWRFLRMKYTWLLAYIITLGCFNSSACFTCTQTFLQVFGWRLSLFLISLSLDFLLSCHHIYLRLSKQTWRATHQCFLDLVVRLRKSEFKKIIIIVITITIKKNNNNIQKKSIACSVKVSGSKRGWVGWCKSRQFGDSHRHCFRDIKNNKIKYKNLNN